MDEYIDWCREDEQQWSIVKTNNNGAPIKRGIVAKDEKMKREDRKRLKEVSSSSLGLRTLERCVMSELPDASRYASSRYASSSWPKATSIWRHQSPSHEKCRTTVLKDPRFSMVLGYPLQYQFRRPSLPAQTSPTMANYHRCGLVGIIWWLPTERACVNARISSWILFEFLLPSFVALERWCNLL